MKMEIEKSKGERFREINSKTMNLEQIKNMMIFLDVLLEPAGLELKKLSRVQAERARELIYKYLYKAGKEDFEKKYCALCMKYNFSDAPATKYDSSVEIFSIIAVRQLLESEKFNKKLKKLKLNTRFAKSISIAPVK